MMSTTTSRVQPLLDDEEEAAEGGLRRITGTDTSGDRDDEALPPVGGSIGVVSHPDGYQYVVKARLAVTVHALLDVVETSNTFSATVELALEWEVSEDQWIGCETFWRDHFIPKVLRVFFDNAKDRENLFAADANEDERVGRDDVGAPLVDSDTGKRARLFRLRRRRTVEFRQPLALQHYPFDYQVLAIRCVAEGAELFGRYFQLELMHPKRSNYGPGRHTIIEDADHVDDLDIESIFALDGRDIAKPGSERPRPQEYAVLLFVSRQYNSTLMNAIVPVFFMEMLSLIIYWVEPCDVADRAAITLTIFLAAVTFKTYMSTLLPALPYLTSVERFLLGGMVLLLGQGLFIARVGWYCVNGENTKGFHGHPWDWRFRHFEEDEDEAWRQSADGTNAAYWKEDDASYWLGSDAARRRMSVRWDQVAFYMTLSKALLTVLALFNRIFWLYYKLYRIDYEKAVAESLGDERALNKQSFLSYVARRARCCYSPAAAVRRRGAAHAEKTPRLEERRRRAVAFFRDLASQSLEGYTNPEVSHRPRVPKTKKAKPEMEATLDEDRCIIFDVGTGEAKAIAYEFVPETTAVKVKDLAKFKDGKVAVKDLCHDRDTSSFVDFVGETLTPRLVVSGSTKPDGSPENLWKLQGFSAVKHERAEGLYTVESWDSDDAKACDRGKGTAVVFVNREPYSPDLARERLERAAELKNKAVPAKDIKVGDRVRAKAAIRYARDADGSAVPVGDVSAPEAIVLPGAKGTAMSVAGSADAKFVRVRWDDHEDLGAALVKADDAIVEIVPEVVFRFWAHASIERSGDAKPRWRRSPLVVGTGSWYRTSKGGDRAVAHNLFGELRKKYDAAVVILSAIDEASYEETATLYAHKLMKWEPPDAVISGGSGSTQASCISPADIGDLVEYKGSEAQVVGRWRCEDGHVYEDGRQNRWWPRKRSGNEKEYCHGYAYDIQFEGKRHRVDEVERVLQRWGKGTKRQSTPHLIQCGNREGKDLILAATTVEEGCEAWEKVIKMRFHEAGFNRDSYIKSCTLMGACFYAAEYAEVPLKGTTVKIAKDKFEAHIRTLKNAAKKVERDEKTATTKDTLAKVKAPPYELGGRNAAQTLSNLMVQARICEMLGDGVSVRYVRDWKLPGADGVVEFRTTWSAGYYLQDLVRRRPYLLAAEDTGFQDLI
ncbi:unnamed protein product [Pelagomonas calceolata]|uniref:Uncharacterized protein n=2 Tax=Pelagomonas calceolata TaxID=35677 RepID=A0A8J2S362_9STRA|nr:unnamed protein product [Pelagomonas calceolata]